MDALTKSKKALRSTCVWEMDEGVFRTQLKYIEVSTMRVTESDLGIDIVQGSSSGFIYENFKNFSRSSIKSQSISTALPYVDSLL